MKKIFKFIFGVIVIFMIGIFISDTFFYESSDTQSQVSSSQGQDNKEKEEQEAETKRPYGYNIETFYQMINNGEINVSGLELELIEKIQSVLIPIIVNTNDSNLIDQNFYVSGVSTNQEGTELLIEVTFEYSIGTKEQVYVDIKTGHVYSDKKYQTDTCSMISIIGHSKDSHGFKIALDQYMKLYGLEYPTYIDLYGENQAYEEEDTYTEDYSYINDGDDYFISDSNIRKLTENELLKYSLEELGYIRNEIFARYGYAFKNAGYRKYFESKDWYSVNDYYSENSIEDALNEVEKYNVDLLNRLEGR